MEYSRKVIAPGFGQKIGERHRIFNRGVRTLPLVRQHTVRGIADQNGRVPMPMPRLLDNEQRPSLVDPSGTDHFRDGGVPALKSRECLSRCGGCDPSIVIPSDRPLGDREEVDVLCSAADSIVEKVSVRAHPELNGLRIRQAREAMSRHDAAKCARLRITAADAAADPAPYDGTDSVGADNEVGFLDNAVLKHELHPRPSGRDIDQTMTELQMLAAKGTTEDFLQACTMDAEVR